jgi:hypothetical protein
VGDSSSPGDIFRRTPAMIYHEVAGTPFHFAMSSSSCILLDPVSIYLNIRQKGRRIYCRLYKIRSIKKVLYIYIFISNQNLDKKSEDRNMVWMSKNKEMCVFVHIFTDT